MLREIQSIIIIVVLLCSFSSGDPTPGKDIEVGGPMGLLCCSHSSSNVGCRLKHKPIAKEDYFYLCDTDGKECDNPRYRFVKFSTCCNFSIIETNNLDIGNYACYIGGDLISDVNIIASIAPNNGNVSNNTALVTNETLVSMASSDGVNYGKIIGIVIGAIIVVAVIVFVIIMALRGWATIEVIKKCPSLYRPTPQVNNKKSNTSIQVSASVSTLVETMDEGPTRQANKSVSPNSNVSPIPNSVSTGLSLATSSNLSNGACAPETPTTSTNGATRDCRVPILDDLLLNKNERQHYQALFQKADKSPEELEQLQALENSQLKKKHKQQKNEFKKKHEDRLAELNAKYNLKKNALIGQHRLENIQMEKRNDLEVIRLDSEQLEDDSAPSPQREQRMNLKQRKMKVEQESATKELKQKQDLEIQELEIFHANEEERINRERQQELDTLETDIFFENDNYQIIHEKDFEECKLKNEKEENEPRNPKNLKPFKKARGLGFRSSAHASVLDHPSIRTHASVPAHVNSASVPAHASVQVEDYVVKYTSGGKPSVQVQSTANNEEGEDKSLLSFHEAHL